MGSQYWHLPLLFRPVFTGLQSLAGQARYCGVGRLYMYRTISAPLIPPRLWDFGGFFVDARLLPGRRSTDDFAGSCNLFLLRWCTMLDQLILKVRRGETPF